MNYTRAIFSCCSLAVVLAVPAVTGAEEASVPDWAYGTMDELAAAGYFVLPENGSQGMSREQMASLTARVLKQLDDANDLQTKQDSDTALSLTKEYTAVVRLLVQDEVQEQRLKDWVTQAKREYKAAFQAVKSDLQAAARYTGTTDDEDKKQLQRKQHAAALDKTAVTLANAEAQLKRHQILMQRTQARKQAIEQDMVAAQLPVDGQPLAPAASEAADYDEEAGAVGDEAGEAEAGEAEAGSPAASQETLLQAAGDLRVEFAAELSDMGYFDDAAAQTQAVSQTTPKQLPMEKRLRIDGEARVDYGHNSGPQSIGNRGRLRLRLYPDYNLDGNWHAIGMIESEKSFIGEGSDGKVKLDHYYLHGRSGATLLDIGAYSTLLGEGNIYDSKFTGVRAQFGGPVHYTAEIGKMDAAHRAYTFTASYPTADYLLEGGWYHFDSIYGGAPRTIYMANFRKPLGWFDFGAMFLRGTDRDRGSGNGYVLTLSHGHEDSWKPGSYSVYAKYYHQPAATYVEHTMNGMADYMSGFEGLGLGYNYIFKKDWMLSLEYDHLRDLRSQVYNNTIWGAVTYFFKNYED